MADGETYPTCNKDGCKLPGKKASLELLGGGALIVTRRCQRHAIPNNGALRLICCKCDELAISNIRGTILGHCRFHYLEAQERGGKFDPYRESLASLAARKAGR